MIKSINLQVNKFGAIEVSAQVEGQKQALEMLVLSNGEGECSVTTSTGLKMSRIYGTWGFDRDCDDKVLQVMFTQAWNVFEANKPVPVAVEE